MSIAKTTAAAAIASALTLTPNKVYSQNPVNDEVIVNEFKDIDKNQNYKMSTIEYLDFVAAQSLNPVEMKTKINEALAKFNSADENNDGELNIDEYKALKENKTPAEVINETPQTNLEQSSNVFVTTSENSFKPNYVEIQTPKLTKAQREEQAFDIINPIQTYYNENYGLFGGKERRLGYERALDAVNKINKSNIAEVINTDIKYYSTFGWMYDKGIDRVLMVLKTKYSANPDMLNKKIRSLYSLLEQRASESNCLNRFNKTRESMIKYIGDRQFEMVPALEILPALAKVILEAEEN